MFHNHLKKTGIVRTTVSLFTALAAAIYPTTDCQATETHIQSSQPDSTATLTPYYHESIFDVNSGLIESSRFTWGADVGTSIDVGGYDMSTFDLDVVVGYKHGLIRTLGVSAGVHRDFSKGNHLIPVCGVLRLAFSPTQELTFLNLKGGYSFNSIGDTDTTKGFVMTAGIGFNLAMSRRFRSHLILSYEYLRLNGEQRILVDRSRNHVDMIQLLFGVTF